MKQRITKAHAIRSEARDRDCEIRLPGICNFNPETTVLAHLRLIGISGFGIKCPDELGAFACSSCHAYVDSHHDDATKIAFYEAIFRTQAQLLRESKLHL
jgi:hypothetical protein